MEPRGARGRLLERRRAEGRPPTKTTGGPHGPWRTQEGTKGPRKIQEGPVVPKMGDGSEYEAGPSGSKGRGLWRSFHYALRDPKIYIGIGILSCAWDTLG